MNSFMGGIVRGEATHNSPLSYTFSVLPGEVCVMKKNRRQAPVFFHNAMFIYHSPTV